MSVYAVIPPVLISTVWLHKERMVASKGSVSTCMRQVRFTWIISSHLLSTRQCRCYCYPHYAEKVVWGSESWSNFPMATLLGSPAVAQPPPPASLELTLSSISYPSKHPVQVHCSENLKRFIRLAFKAFPPHPPGKHKDALVHIEPETALILFNVFLSLLLVWH